MNKNKERLKFRLSFYNDAADADTERRLVEDFTGLNRRLVPAKDMDDFFYKEEFYGDNAMRCYYLAMLRQLCNRHNILMDFDIRTDKNFSKDLAESTGALVTTLSFGL